MYYNACFPFFRRSLMLLSSWFYLIVEWRFFSVACILGFSNHFHQLESHRKENILTSLSSFSFSCTVPLFLSHPLARMLFLCLIMIFCCFACAIVAYMHIHMLSRCDRKRDLEDHGESERIKIVVIINRK